VLILFTLVQGVNGGLAHKTSTFQVIKWSFV